MSSEKRDGLYAINGDSRKEPNGDVEVGTEEGEDRGQWANKWEFILSCIGLSVGLGNVWRFPYLAYENGGAAFLIAYLILQFLIGKPMYFMELVLGQFSGLGPTGVWKMNPSAKGVGISMALISLVVAIYYNVIMAYTLIYFFSSMQETLPWTVCEDSWIPKGCVEASTRTLEYCSTNVTALIIKDEPCRCFLNATDNYLAMNGFNCTNVTYQGEKPIPSAQFYFDETVINKADKFYGDTGLPSYKLALCLLLSWIIVILCLVKGIKSSGKVVYFTATFPYVILLILLIRGCTLDGAIDGVKYFIIPEWSKLADLKVWVAAAGQMFFSLSVSFGGIIMFGSYNKFNNNVYGDAMLIASMDLITSVIAGFVIFTTFGALAKKTGLKVSEVARGGYGLAFVAYPEALSNLPVPQLWSVLFFFMLFTLGLDSEFALMETTLTCIQDEFPKTRKYKSHMCIGFGIVCFFLALPCVTPTGDYIVSLMDGYGADFSVLCVATCECVSVFWVYGVTRFMKDIEIMLGRSPTPSVYWLFCWVLCAPLLIGGLFCYRLIAYKDPGNPEFAQALGWTLTAIVLCPIPFYYVYKFIRTPGSAEERVWKIMTPADDWGPQNKKIAYNPDLHMKGTQMTDLSKNSHAYDNPVSRM